MAEHTASKVNTYRPCFILSLCLTMITCVALGMYTKSLGIGFDYVHYQVLDASGLTRQDIDIQRGSGLNMTQITPGNPHHAQNQSDQQPLQQQQKQQLQPQPQQQPRQQPNKIILFWVPYYQHSDYGFGFGQAGFLKHKCPVNTCMTTDNRALVKQASAIVFHNRNVSPKNVLPTPRFNNQSYVFFLKEPPPLQGIDLGHYKQGFFNLTWTFRRDSDIHVPYGEFNPGFSARPDEQVTTIMKGKNKKKLVAWIVSHCGTPSKRENYVKELQKHIPVDVYGGCGPLKCDRSTPALCYDMLEKNYKFYISFENSVCEDYVTEKLFNVLPLYIVPIVFGGGNYSAIAPPGSVINVRDYGSPRQLAEYLLKLDSDDSQYMKYFEWKQRYNVLSNHDAFTRSICRLCEKLNAPLHTRQRVYTNLTKWWNTDAKCDNGIINKLLH